MKILLLLSGYPGNINSVKDTSNLNYNQVNFDPFYKGFHYFRNLLRDHETKVVTSIWDNIGSEEIIKSYKPKALSSHNQKEFQDNFDKHFRISEENRIYKRKKWFKNYNLKDYPLVPTSRYASQLFIRQEVCRTALKYIKNSEFNPDMIILSRFDIGTRGGILIRNPIEIDDNLSTIFEINNENPFIVIPEFNQLNLGYPDMWYYLNKTALHKMQKIYDVYINSIFREDSSYVNYLTKGWPSSEWYDLKEKNDLRQFSNIILTGNKTNKKMRYPSWESTNIHMFYKYFISIYDQPFKIHFSKGYLAYVAMFKFLGYKFSFKSLINLLIIFIKTKIKMILEKIRSLCYFGAFN